MDHQKPIRHLALYLEQAAQHFPDQISTTGPGGRLTYAELNEMSNRVANFLIEKGLEPGDRVGLVLSKSIQAVSILFGILKARCVYVPVDRNAPMERNLVIHTDCQIRILFIDPSLDATPYLEHPGKPEVIVGVPIEAKPSTISPSMISWETLLCSPCSMVDSRGRTEGDLAFILYTSGSTGKPKGVMLSHLNACSFVDWCSETFSPTQEDRFSSHAPFHFDLSVLDLYVSTKHGASLHLVGEDVAGNPGLCAGFIEEHEITVWYSTPSILTMMVQFGKLSRFNASSLRLILFAGEVFPVKHLRKLTEIWNHAGYWNLYGPTETNVCTSAWIPLPIDGARTEPYPIGPVCSHCEALVLLENGEVAVHGESGLLHIAGPSVCRGYWGMRAENEGRFVERDGIVWYNTGDVVKFQPGEGYLFMGRLDRMVKRRGYRIELGEIENALYKGGDTREAAVIASEDQSGVKIIAYLSTGQKTGSQIAFKKHCSDHLPGYMIPDRFIFLESLPKTSTGKIDYQKLTMGGGKDSGTMMEEKGRLRT